MKTNFSNNALTMRKCYIWDWFFWRREKKFTGNVSKY